MDFYDDMFDGLHSFETQHSSSKKRTRKRRINKIIKKIKHEQTNKK
jgi:hypothetical protein